VAITRPRTRTLLAAAAALAAALSLSACVPEPGSTRSPSSAPTSPDASGTPTASAEPSVAPSDRPQALEIALPDTCDALYSSSMRAALDADLPPLNDPGVTMASTRLEQAREIIESGVPTLRCTWGTASETGLSTNVTILAPEDVPRIQDMLAVNGLSCSDVAGGILCTTQSAAEPQSAADGESHFLRGNGWVATAWVGQLPDGYIEDVAKTLWG
jgi:hypothetical protein